MHTTRPLFVRPLTDAERRVLEDSLRSPEAFVLRRAQIVLASAAGERSGQIAPRVGFTPQAVRDVNRAFNARGLDVLRRGAPQPSVIYSAFDTPRALALRDPLHLREQTVARDDPDPKALACYGLLARCWDATVRRSEEMWLRFVDGRPVS